MKRSALSLAGWLFADLAIVLTLVFAPSRLVGSDFPESSDGSTTTIPQAEVGAGVSPEPYVVTVEIRPTFQISEITNRLNAALIEAGVPTSERFGVVLIYAGVKEDTVGGRQEAVQRARGLRSKFRESNWERLKVWTYYEAGSDTSLAYPMVKLKLFPDRD